MRGSQAAEEAERQNAYAGAYGATRLLMAYLKAVAEQQGLAEALRLLAEVAEATGRARGAVLAERLKARGGDALEAAAVFAAFLRGTGLEVQLEEAVPFRAVASVTHRCPVFAAAAEEGLPGAEVCRHLCQILGPALVRAVNPDLDFVQTHTRRSQGESCQAVITHLSWRGMEQV